MVTKTIAKSNIYVSLAQSNPVPIAQKPKFDSYEKVIQALNKQTEAAIPNNMSPLAPTSIPNERSLIGQILQNPTTVSISDMQKMAHTDPVIYSDLQYISKIITGRIKQFKHKNKEIEYFINYSFNNLKIGRAKFFDALHTANWAGFAAMFKVWGVYKGKYIYKNVIPMPPTSIIMACNQDGSLKDYGGIMQYYYNTNLNGWANGFTYSVCGISSPNASYGDFDIPLRIPYINPVYLKPFHTKDILLYNLSGNDSAMSNNPYGKGLCRSVYNSWTSKQGVLQNLLIAITYKAAPLILFYTNPQRQIDENGNSFTIGENLTQQLTTYSGNGFIVLGGMEGQAIQHAVIDNTAKMDDFIDCLNYLDTQIHYGLTAPDLQSTSSFATATAHGSVHSKIIDSMTENLIDVLLQQFVRPQIEANWKNETDWGYFEETEQTLDDKLKAGKLMEMAIQSYVARPDINLEDLNKYRMQFACEPVNAVFPMPIENQPEQSENQLIKPNKRKSTEQSKVDVTDTKRKTDVPYAASAINDAERWDKV
jgi:hypothetical protein